ncbi:MAG: hypothetical protein Q8J85_07055 [Sulfuricurvum sp.]|nr:hypothetical protein [Sulfuricurvum sp.]MDP3023016.1 hypothetical protein [Sulfuricurvum sp.]
MSILNVGSGIMYIQYKIRNPENKNMDTILGLVVLDKDNIIPQKNLEDFNDFDEVEMMETLKSSELFDLLYSAFQIHGEKYVFHVSSFFTETIMVVDKDENTNTYNYEKFKKEFIGKK